MKRRDFLSLGTKAIIIAGAPAIVRAESLMKIWVPPEQPKMERWPSLSQQPERLGWMPCDGRVISRASAPRLYSLIGNTYGGDEVFFNLPDLTGQMIYPPREHVPLSGIITSPPVGYCYNINMETGYIGCFK